MSGKYFLVTGSNGMLGSNLVDHLQFKQIVGYDSLSLDITDSNLVNDILTKEKPDVIIHAAAYTNVEDCEINQDKAYKITAIMPAFIPNNFLVTTNIGNTNKAPMAIKNHCIS